MKSVGCYVKVNYYGFQSANESLKLNPKLTLYNLNHDNFFQNI